ncbi:class I SAM-dependent methyltransferase [Mesorhizobium sp. BR1-1-7]|uniref:class I SAM-dependent methyltransferase n=1 Tax=Mesorhizobium sp. BR1-1-7 TaxID=2876647 RepID=UPI001CCA212D|nr:class I SAM-dependent methyltransferase [Mesorhizobium sp. BR1-1-7]MBZ9921953.1 class I SAM-dependent methyltransferase [Mesorhizobium sp. BR1-1-7]
MRTDRTSAADAPSLEGDETHALFNRELAAYRKIVGENLMFHREVYGLLHDVLSREMPRPFKFLDIACGDAVASAAALKGTSIDRYYGLDLSARSLQLATEALKALPCPVELRCCDFVGALADWAEPVDVVWIGMSLHHLQPEGKIGLIEDVHDALSRSGIFLIWEPTLLEGESRDEWLDRFSACRAAFASVTDDEFAAMESHMRLADFPEPAETWMAMGHQAGFGKAEQLFMMPNRLGRVFKYWK